MAPQPSRQPRLPQRQRGSEQGSYIDHRRNIQLRQDSGLERTNGTRLSTRPEITSLQEQVRCRWVDEDGTIRIHILDLLATTADGERVGIAQKYEADVDRSGVEDVLRRCAQDADRPDNVLADGRPLADRFRVLDERPNDGVTIGNVGQIRRFLGDRDGEALAIVRDWLADEAPERFALGDVRTASGLGFRGMRACIALLATGEVVLADHVPIDRDAIFVNRLFNPQ